MVTILKFNDQYSNYAGIAQVQGTLLNTPTWNEDRQTNLATMHVESFEVQIEDEIHTVEAGAYTVGAKGNQFNAELHQEGKKVSFNITFTPGKNGPLFTLAPFTGVRGEMPKFGAVRKVAPVDNVSVTAADLVGA